MRERWIVLAAAMATGLSGALGHPSPAAAQETPLASPRFEDGEYRGAEGSRRYKLFVPARAGERSSSSPLVVFLHGCTQTAEDVARGTRLNDMAATLGIAILYPEQAPEANANRCWNWYDAAHQRRGAGEPALIAAMAREAGVHVGADPARISIAGISAGGAMALIVAGAYPDLFAAAGTHSGMAPGSATSIGAALTAMREGATPPADALVSLMGDRLRPLPLIVLHGDADQVVHPRNAAVIVEQWKRAFALGEPATTLVRGGAEATEEPRGYQSDVYALPNGVPLLESWRIVGLGHAWSGGSPAGSYTDPRGPDASMELLRFLTAHRLSAASPAAAGRP